MRTDQADQEHARLLHIGDVLGRRHDHVCLVRGADSMDGGAGIDTANYFDDGLDSAGQGPLGVSVKLATGTAKDNWGKTDTLVRIENVIQAVAAMTTDQHIIYNSTTGLVSYDAHGKGTGAARAFLQITPGQALTASDFRVV